MNIKKIAKISGVILITIIVLVSALRVTSYPRKTRVECDLYARDISKEYNNFVELKMRYDFLYNACLHSKGMPSESGYNYNIK